MRLFGVTKTKCKFPEGGCFDYSSVDKKVEATIIHPHEGELRLRGLATSHIEDNIAWRCVNMRVLEANGVDFTNVYLQADLSVNKRDPEFSSAIVFLRAFPGN